MWRILRIPWFVLSPEETHMVPSPDTMNIVSPLYFWFTVIYLEQLRDVNHSEICPKWHPIPYVVPYFWPGLLVYGQTWCTWYREYDAICDTSLSLYFWFSQQLMWTTQLKSLCFSYNSVGKALRKVHWRACCWKWTFQQKNTHLLSKPYGQTG